MRVLVTWGSMRGSTEGIARVIADTLREHGFEVVCESVEKVHSLDRFDAVVVGGALYANRWPAKARRFVNRELRALRHVPVWFFSSGPLDASADRELIAMTPAVRALGERVGAKGHATFGGRLTPGAKGFLAGAMAKKHAGDFRNVPRIRAWARAVALELPHAVPGRAIEHEARSVGRWLAYGAVGWALCAASMGAFQKLFGIQTALVLHALAAPSFFVLVARHYFRARGAREPAATAALWTAEVVVLDVALATFVLRSPAMFTSFIGTWLPFCLIFAATWATGSAMATLPSSMHEGSASTGDGRL